MNGLVGATFVLLPGLDGSGRLFRRFQDAAPRGVAIRVVPLPRHGDQDPPALASRLREELPQCAKLFLLGESYAGPVALELAASRPAALAGVVLSATFAMPPGPRWARYLPWEALFSLRPSDRLLRFLMFGRNDDPALLDEVREVRRTAPAALLAVRLRQALLVDARQALGACPVPLLYLQASGDRIVPRRCLAPILRVRPDTVVRRFDSGHLILQMRATEAWRAIAEWVAGASVV